MKFKIDGKERSIPDEVLNAIEDAEIGIFRSPQEWGVEGLTWEDKDGFHLTIFDDRIFIWRTIADFDEPENARRICEDIIKALKKKGIKATMDELAAGHNAVDIWLETGKKFEELTLKDIQKPLEIFKTFRTISVDG